MFSVQYTISLYSGHTGHTYCSHAISNVQSLEGAKVSRTLSDVLRVRVELPCYPDLPYFGSVWVFNVLVRYTSLYISS